MLKRFESSRGPKEVTTIRLSKEVKQLVTELAACSDDLSIGEVLEAGIYLAFQKGLLCNSKDAANIRKKVNAETQKNIKAIPKF